MPYGQPAFPHKAKVKAFTMDTKICSRCNSEYPATYEYFRVRSEAPSGLRGQCKSCEKQLDKEKYWSDPDAYNQYQRKYYYDNLDKVRKQNRENMKSLRAKDPEKHRKYALEYTAKNRHIYRAANKKWYYTNHEYSLNRVKKYKQANKNNPEYKEKISVYNRRAKYLRKVRNGGGFHTAMQLRDLYSRSGGCCAYCGCDVGTKYHFDHITPLIRGGSNDISNLCVACPKCNLSKGSKLLSEWVNRWYVA